MNLQAFPPEAARGPGPPSQARKFFDGLMNLSYYISSVVVFLLILGGIVLCIHCFIICLQEAFRKFVTLLRSWGVMQAPEERKMMKVLKNLPPPVKYRTQEGIVSFNACAICLEDFKDGELCQVLPLCNHAFHSACIKPWLINNQRCPNCRSPITDPS